MYPRKANRFLILFQVLLLVIFPMISSSSFADEATMGLSPEKLAEIEQKVEPVLNGKPVTDIPEEDRNLIFLAEGLFPDSFDLFFRHGEYLAKEKQDFTQAIPRLKKALDLEAKHLETLELLASCHTALKQEADAVSCWETLREILDQDDSPETSQIRERVMLGLEEMAKENQMIMRQGKRFIVYTPTSSNFHHVDSELTDERLEEVYQQVTNDLECIPAYRTSIITLDPIQFEEVSPTSWAGGFAKGGKSMVLPADNFARSDPESILPAKPLVLHEYTHNIIFILGNGKCPTWLNEGLAVFAQNKNRNFTEFKPTIPPPGEIMSTEELEQEFRDIRALPKSEISRVRKAYKLAELYARFLIQNFTMTAPRQIINVMKGGMGFDIALDQASKLTVSGFEQRFRNWLNELSF